MTMVQISCTHLEPPITILLDLLISGCVNSPFVCVSLMAPMSPSVSHALSSYCCGICTDAFGCVSNMCCLICCHVCVLVWICRVMWLIIIISSVGETYFVLGCSSVCAECGRPPLTPSLPLNHHWLIPQYHLPLNHPLNHQRTIPITTPTLPCHSWLSRTFLCICEVLTNWTAHCVRHVMSHTCAYICAHMCETYMHIHIYAYMYMIYMYIMCVYTHNMHTTHVWSPHTARHLWNMYCVYGGCLPKLCWVWERP